MKKRLLSALLTLCMVLTLLPVSALAETDDSGSYVQNGASVTQDGVTVSKTAKRTGENAYNITLSVTIPATVTVPGQGADVVLVIDSSGSMGNDEKMDTAKNSAEAFAGALLTGTTGVRVAIVDYDNSAKAACRLTNDLDVVNSAIQDIGAGGGTHIQGGIHEARMLLSGSTAYNKVIVVISDGDPTYSYPVKGSGTLSHHSMGPFAVYHKGVTASVNNPVTESDFDYDDRTGDGSHYDQGVNVKVTGYCDTCRRTVTGNYDGDDRPFKNNGDPAIAEAGFAITAGCEIYSLYLGTPSAEAQYTMSGIATDPSHYKQATNDSLSALLSQIAGSVTSTTAGAVTDPMGANINLGDVSELAGVTKTSSGLTWTPQESQGTKNRDGSTTYTVTYPITVDVTEDGWYSANGTTTFAYKVGSQERSVNFNVPQVWGQAPEATICYVALNGGSVSLASETVQSGNIPVGSTATAGDNAYFVGWYSDEACTTQVSTSETYVPDAPTPGATVTYYAKFNVKDAVTVTAKSDTVTYDGTVKSVNGVSHTDLPDGYTLTATASAFGTNVGEYKSQVTDVVIKDATGVDVTYKFAITKIDGKLTINQRAITIQAASDDKEYDGTPLTNSDSSIITGDLVTGHSYTVTVTGSQTDVGDSPNVPSNAMIVDSRGANVTQNYNITYSNGTLTVNKDTGATIEATGYTGTYDGQYHNGVTGIDLKTSDGQEISDNGWTFTYTYNGNETDKVPQFKDAGKYVVTVKGSNLNYLDVSTTVTVTISKRAVTLTSPNQNKEYDGTALTGDLEKFTQTGFVEGEGVTFNNPASITNVGNTTNTINYNWNSGTNKDNYTVTKEKGTLTISPNDSSEVALSATAYTGVYDGSAHALITNKAVTGAVEGTDWTYTYSTDGTNFTSTMPTGTNAGDYPVYVKASNSNYTDKTVQVTAKISPQKVTLTSGSDSKSYDGTPLTAENVNAVGFVGSDNATYSNFASITDVGDTDNTFVYTLNEGTLKSNYEITQAYGKLKITKNTNASLTVNGYKGTYDGQSHTVSTSISQDVPGTVWTYQYKTSESSEWQSEMPAFTDAGTYTVYVKATNLNYEDLTGNAPVNIAKRHVTLTSASATKSYDGNPLTNSTVTVSSPGFVEGEGATYTVTGSQTNVGTSDNTFTYTLNGNTKEGNYEIKKDEGDLTVTLYAGTDVALVASPYTAKYDGQEHDAVTSYSVSGVNIQGLEWNYTFSIDGSTFTDTMPSVKDVGSYPVTIKATNTNFNDVTAVVTAQITEREVTLTSGTSSKVYDGNALTNHTVSVIGDGFASGEGFTSDVTGSQTIVGSSDNTFTYTLNEGTNAGNYIITTECGRLTVTDRGQDDEHPLYEITVQANSDEFVEDGTPKTVSGLKQTEFVVHDNNYTVEGLSAERTETDPGVYPVEITGTAVVKDAEDNDVTAQFNVIKQNGTLTIYKDQWKDVDEMTDPDPDEKDSETGGDGIPDYKQALIKYESAGNGSVSPTVQVETLAEQADGSFSKDVTAKSTANAESGYAFDYWVKSEVQISSNKALEDTFTAEGDKTYVYTAYFDKDTWKDSDETPDEEDTDSDTEGDGIPDKYQVHIVYTAATGGTVTGTKLEIVTLKNAGGTYASSGSVTASGSSASANSGYRFASWTDNTNVVVGSNAKLDAQTIKDAKGGSTYTFTANFNRRNTGSGDYTPAPKPQLNKEDHFAYVSGYPDGTVQPNDYITREEVATIFFRLLTDKSRADYITEWNPFPDITSSRWSFYSITTMNNGELMVGRNNGLFDPSANITRAEFAVVAAQFSDAKDPNRDYFTDVSGHWAESYINRAASVGWIAGYPDGTFRPDQPITRAEVMALVNEVLERAPHEDHMLEDMIHWPDNRNEDVWYYEDVQEATNAHTYVWTSVTEDGKKRQVEDWQEIVDMPTYDELVRAAFLGKD